MRRIDYMYKVPGLEEILGLQWKICLRSEYFAMKGL